MKYFSPSYWFKMWLLSAPLFNSKNEGIYAKSIDNQNIKDWASNNTNLELIENKTPNLSNNQIIQFQNNENIPSSKNLETDDFYENFLKTQGWSNNPEIAQQQLIEIQSEHHNFLKQEHERIKKQVTPYPKPSKKILEISNKLIINKNIRKEYQTSFQNIINELVNNEVFSRVRDLSILVNPEIDLGDDDSILALNQVRYGYFRLPVEIRWEDNQQNYIRNLELVLRTDNLYLQGFIINHHNNFADLPFNNDAETTIQTYYHFDFNNINMNMQPQAVRDGTVPILTQIEGIQSIQLTGISPDYRDMIPLDNNNINWENIFDSFLRLTNDINVNTEQPLGTLARALCNVIVVSAESLRFWSLHTHIIQQLVNRSGNIVLGRNNRNSIYNTLVSWSEESRTQNLIIDLLSTTVNGRPNPTNPLEARNILIEYGYLRRRDNPSFTNLLARILILPINDITNILLHSNIRVILNYFIRPNLNNCRRGKRDITNNDFWHKKFCDLKPQIDKIQEKITAIKVLDENTKGFNLKAGTIYVGTENGVYLIYPEGEVHKFDGLNFPITSIKLDNLGSAYITNNQGEIYHLNLVGWGSEKLNNLESSDLNKKIELYYHGNERNRIEFHSTYTGDGKISFPIVSATKGFFLGGIIGKVFFDETILPGPFGFVKNAWTYSSDTDEKNHKTVNLENNLGQINPFDYEKIEILTDTDNNDIYTQASRGNENFWGNKITDCINGNMKSEFNCPLMNLDEGKFHCEQYVNLNFYKNNNNYYLRFSAKQYAKNNAWLFANDGGMWIGVGTGFRLYNNDETIRTKRNIKSNENKWTNDFSKSINHEQHLSINNKTNFVSSNITNL